MYKKLDKETIDRIEDLVEGNIIRDPDMFEAYSHDEFALPDIRRLPEVVVRPTSVEQISNLLAFANEQRIPVTARGGATGLCGGCVPVYGGIVLSFERMTQVLEIDTKNLTATLEPGVSLMQFAPEAEKFGLFFSPRPGDEAATFGGIVSTNAGGSRALGYGVTRDCTLALEVVLADGRVMTLSTKTFKDSTGYSLLNLMIGSEGTLAIVTRVTVRLDPIPQAATTLLVPYPSLHDAISTVPAIIAKGTRPVALEFLEQDVVTVAEKKREIKSHFTGGEAYLMVELNASDEAELESRALAIADICAEFNSGEPLLADTKERQAEIWDFRGKLYEALKDHCIEILDVVVPPAEIANHVEAVHKIAEKYNVWLPNYGHAGDGNVHSNLMKARVRGGELEPIEEEEWRRNYEQIRDEIHADAKQRGGLVSGEHGIGLTKKKYLSLFCDPVRIEIMKKTKKVLDPNNILNPGKIFDLE